MPSLVSLVGAAPLHRGSTGPAVMWLQTALNLVGYSLSVDAHFGSVTETAVKEFQASHGLPIDGRVDEATARALDAEMPASGLARQTWPSQYRPECTNFYGDPEPGQNGHLSSAWQRDYLIHVPPVYPMVWDLDPNDGRGQPVRYWTINKKCSDSAVRCFKAILEAYPNRVDLEAHHLQWWGGSFAFRAIRGGHMMSTHSLGAAIDFAPTWNPQHKPYNEADDMLPMKVVRIFEAEGWTWGGRWSRASVDCMHFQAAHL